MAELTEEQKIALVEQVKLLVDDLYQQEAIQILFNAAFDVYSDVCAENEVPVEKAHEGAHIMVCEWFEHISSDDDDDDMPTPSGGVNYAGNA